MKSKVSARIRSASFGVALMLVAGFVAFPGPAQSVTPSGPNGLVVADSATGLVAIDPVTGTRTALAGSSGFDNDPQVSPDGTKVTFENGDNIWIADFPSGNNRFQVTTTSTSFTPSFSTDGTTIVFACPSGLCTALAAGPFPATTTQVIGSQPGDSNPVYGPRGGFIYFDTGFSGTDAEGGVSSGIFRVSANNGGSRTQLSGTTSGDNEPAVSPDGSRVYFDNSRTASAGAGIFFVPAPDGGARTTLTGTSTGDDSAFPSPDGRFVGFDTFQAPTDTGLNIVSANGTGGRGQIAGTATSDEQGHWARVQSPAPSQSPTPSFSPAPTPMPSPTGTITGTATRAVEGFEVFFNLLVALFGGPTTDDPVAGAIVTVTGTGLTATTGADGRYTINNVPAGSQTVTAVVPALDLVNGGQSAQNCTDASDNTTQTVAVPAGGTATANWECPVQGSIGFSLLDALFPNASN